jgi:hypothetical protein
MCRQSDLPTNLAVSPPFRYNGRSIVSVPVSESVRLLPWPGQTREKDAGGVSMADKDQKKKSATNKPKLTVKEKKERNERKRAAKNSK